MYAQRKIIFIKETSGPKKTSNTVHIPVQKKFTKEGKKLKMKKKCIMARKKGYKEF